MTFDSNNHVFLETPNMLNLLIKQCETRCVAQCCGLEAFNFSPLNIAFFFTVNELKPECISKERKAQCALVRVIWVLFRALWERALTSFAVSGMKSHSVLALTGRDG